MMPLVQSRVLGQRPSVVVPLQAMLAQKKNLHKMMGISPSDIDVYSRILFPLSFFTFNLMYWIIYLYISDEIAEDLVMLHPDEFN
jgi:pyruvate carboxylase